MPPDFWGTCEYVFQDIATYEQRDPVLVGIAYLVRDMEETGHTLICTRLEYKDIMTTKNLLNFPSAGRNLKRSIATQFVLRENYWSQVHFDYDKILCILSVLPGKAVTTHASCTTFASHSTKLPFHLGLVT